MLRFSHNFGFGNKNFNYKTFCRAIYRKYNKGKMGYTNECYNHMIRIITNFSFILSNYITPIEVIIKIS